MKQRFLLSLLFVCTFMTATKAQIAKESVWLGGGLGYSNSKSDIGSTQKNKSFNISPAIGKAIKENLVAGIRIGYSETDNSSKSDISYWNAKNEYYGGGIFLRRYVPVATKLYIFGEGTATFGATKQIREESYSSNKVHTKTTGWSAGLNFTPGVSYGITKIFQLETGFNSLFSLSYGKSKAKDIDFPNNKKQTSQGFSAGISLENASTFYIGFRVLINNKS